MSTLPEPEGPGPERLWVPQPDPERSAAEEIWVPRPEAPGSDSDFGQLGKRFDRSSPFWIGMAGGLGLLVAYATWLALAATSRVLLLIALALEIAIGLDPLVGLLQRRGLPRWAGVLIVTVGALGVLGLFLALAIPPIVSEVDSLITSAPHYLQSLQSSNSLLGRINRQFNLVNELKRALPTVGAGLGSGIIGVGETAIGVVEDIFIVVVLTIYFVADMARIKHAIHRVLPRSRRPRAEALVDETFSRVGGYVLGNLITSVIAGIGTFVWAEIFSIPYPFVLSLFVGLMDLIPIVGSTIAGIVVALVALTVSLPIAIATVVFYIVYRNAEDYLITPRVMRSTVRVPGLVTVLAVVLGGTLLGLLGALIAIPVAATIQLLVEEITYPRMDVS